MVKNEYLEGLLYSLVYEYFEAKDGGDFNGDFSQWIGHNPDVIGEAVKADILETYSRADLAAIAEE